MKNRFSADPAIRQEDDILRDYAFHLYLEHHSHPGSELAIWREALACLDCLREMPPLSHFAASGGRPTRAMVYARTRELASLAGRSPLEICQDDYEQAKRELTGESDLERQGAMLDSAPNDRRWHQTE